MPTRGSSSAAGLDVFSPISLTFQPGQIEVVPLDLAIECPEHSYVRIAPRSGLAVKHGLDTLAGVIDSDFRGNVGGVLINHGTVTAPIHEGQRIAQLILLNFFLLLLLLSTPLALSCQRINLTRID